MSGQRRARRVTDLLIPSGHGLPLARTRRRRGLARAAGPRPRTRRWSPTRRASRPRWPSSASGWPAAIPSTTRATRARCSSRRTRWRSRPTRRRCTSTPTTTRSTAGRRRARWRSRSWATSGRMFGFPADALGHLTSSGTIANLEALWVARELHPGKAIAFGTNAHYTHSRMCAVLGVEGDRHRRPRGGGRAAARVGTVVVTAGTTGLGTVDDVEEAVALRERYGVRCTSTPPTAASSRCSTSSSRWRPSAPSPAPTASSSTRTSTACSPTAAARCCSATRASGGCTSTTRRTPTSRPATCTWARSRSSAPAPARPRRRCG